MLCVCARAGERVLHERTIYATQRRRSSDETKFVYIRHSRSTGQSFVVQTSNCIDHWVWIFAIQKISALKLCELSITFKPQKTRTILLWNKKRIWRNRAQNSKTKTNRKLSVSKPTEEKVILLSLTKEKSKNKKINQNVRKNECKFYRCWCCFRHHLHQ